jgi:hypothetical protein
MKMLKTLTPPTIAVARTNDPMSEYAREKNNLDPNWQWCEVLAGDKFADSEIPDGMIRIRGAVYNALTSGKRKGKPNYKKVVDGSKRTIFFASSDLKKWKDERELKTGKCQDCDGTGSRMVGWSKDEGCKYKPCERCDVTGTFPPPPKASVTR